MRRRVILCLPDQPSEKVLAVARTIRESLSRQFQVRLRLADEFDDEDDELTPVDNPIHDLPIVLRISEGDETH
jgi:hypothetical protein